MNRRNFLATIAAGASALILPYEPKRIYSFGSGVGRGVNPYESLESRALDYLRIELLRPDTTFALNATPPEYVFLPGDWSVAPDGIIYTAELA